MIQVLRWVNTCLLRQEVMSLCGPVVRVPTQEPASKGGWFRSLFDSDDGGTRISAGRVALEVALSWDRTSRTSFRASADPRSVSDRLR